MESLLDINQWICDQFGKHQNGQPYFRMVFSDHMTEKRLVNCTENGTLLLQPIAVEQPKYSYIKGRHILEQLTAVPEANQAELLGIKLSYEPLYVFEDEEFNPIPYGRDVIYALIHTIREQLSKAYNPIKQDEKEGNTAEAIFEREQALMKLLHGDRSITDALHFGEAVGYTGMPKSQMD